MCSVFVLIIFLAATRSFFPFVRLDVLKFHRNGVILFMRALKSFSIQQCMCLWNVKRLRSFVWLPVYSKLARHILNWCKKLWSSTCLCISTLVFINYVTDFKEMISDSFCLSVWELLYKRPSNVFFFFFFGSNSSSGNDDYLFHIS